MTLFRFQASSCLESVLPNVGQAAKDIIEEGVKLTTEVTKEMKMQIENAGRKSLLLKIIINWTPWERLDFPETCFWDILSNVFLNAILCHKYDFTP